MSKSGGPTEREDSASPPAAAPTETAAQGLPEASFPAVEGWCVRLSPLPAAPAEIESVLFTSPNACACESLAPPDWSVLAPPARDRAPAPLSQQIAARFSVLPIYLRPAPYLVVRDGPQRLTWVTRVDRRLEGVSPIAPSGLHVMFPFEFQAGIKLGTPHLASTSMALIPQQSSRGCVVVDPVGFAYPGAYPGVQALYVVGSYSVRLFLLISAASTIGRFVFTITGSTSVQPGENPELCCTFDVRNPVFEDIRGRMKHASLEGRLVSPGVQEISVQPDSFESTSPLLMMLEILDHAAARSERVSVETEASSTLWI